MRVAIVGTGGLAFLISHFLQTETDHQFILLSRSPRPALVQRGWQVILVDYNDQQSLDFALRGIDVVVSTVPGLVQISIIDAAIRVSVRRFAPAEFEGRPLLRPVDALDRGRAAVLTYLQQNRSRIEYTVFVCGIFYERFAPGGLYASNIGLGSGFSNEGDYMINLRQMTARLPLYNLVGQYVTLCMTSAQDVGRFVAHAVGVPQWPPEMAMCGERITTLQLVNLAQTIRGQAFPAGNLFWHSPQTLTEELVANAMDPIQTIRTLSLIATQEARYDFISPNLNAAFPNIRPLRLQPWLTRVWQGQ